MLKKWVRRWLGVVDIEKELMLESKLIENKFTSKCWELKNYSDALQQEIEHTRQIVLQIEQKIGMTNSNMTQEKRDAALDAMEKGGWNERSS